MIHSLHTGLVSVTFRRLSPAEIIHLAARAGLEGIEWGGDVHLPPGDLPAARQVRRMAHDHGITTCAYGSYYRLGEPQSGEFEAVLETAIEIDAPTIRVWAGSMGSRQASPADWHRIVADGQRIARLAAEAGMTISLEYHENTLTDDAACARQLIEKIGAPNVLSLWQRPMDADPYACRAGLMTILDDLGNVHVNYWKPSYDRLPLAAGREEWAVYLAVASLHPRERWFELEFVRDDAIAAFFEDAAVLKELVANQNARLDAHYHDMPHAALRKTQK